jgi:hypothetical protein
VTPLSDIPINAYCWFLGAITLFVLGVKSLVGYRKTHVQLTKYMTWFSAVFFISLIAFSVPALFTLDPDNLRTTYLVGEFFFYAGMVTQAAIMWCLVLRRHFSIYYVTVPVAALALVAWLYDIPHSRLSLAHNFITYLDPQPVPWVITMMMTGLFVPVGVYFLRAAFRQTGVKATVISFVLGMMYVGIGFSTGSQELINGQIISPASAIVNLIISAMLLTALVMPWQLSVKLPGQVESPASVNTS